MFLNGGDALSGLGDAEGEHGEVVVVELPPNVKFHQVHRRVGSAVHTAVYMKGSSKRLCGIF
jgi:hypothetical protein